MKSIQTRLAAFVLLLAFTASALAQEVLIACKLDDPKSASYCKGDPRAAIACQRAYRFIESKRLVAEETPGVLLPPFLVEQWSDTTVSLKREVETLDTKVRELIRTRFDRLNGRLLEYSTYFWVGSGAVLTKEELSSFEAEQVRVAGLFGYLNRDPITAECKVAKAAF